MVRIATWNIERLKHKDKLAEIIRFSNALDVDIFVLTETDEQVQLDYPYRYQTPRLTDAPLTYQLPVTYKPTENRVSIFSNYPCIRQHETYDRYTSICVEFTTPIGNLLVYGTIIGINGNRHPSFKNDIARQCDDFKKLVTVGNLCICGDFNCTFADNYYFTKHGRDTLEHMFLDNKINLLTRNQLECIDHIAISQDFIANGNITVAEWNFDKSLSDHKGTLVDICFPRENKMESFKDEYDALLLWNTLEFMRISVQLKKEHRPSKLDGYTPEFAVLDDDFDKKFHALKWKYDID